MQNSADFGQSHLNSAEFYFSHNEISAAEADSPEEECDFCVYDDIKAKLMEKGVDEKEIAFIHDAKTEKQKSDLFEKVRNGDVRVLLGSTAKMGTGTNVQDKFTQENVNVSAKLKNRRWTTEITERDHLYLEKLGVV